MPCETCIHWHSEWYDEETKEWRGYGLFSGIVTPGVTHRKGKCDDKEEHYPFDFEGKNCEKYKEKDESPF